MPVLGLTGATGAVPSKTVFHIVFYEPRIPANTGAAIRLAAVTGTTLHLIEPLGFDLSDAKLRRAGLDYHDLARVRVHADFDAAVAHLQEYGSGRIYAFTGHTEGSFADVAYEEGDALLFGPEPTGLPQHVVDDERISEAVRIPMMPSVRSLNLANAASIAVYEAWRQHGFTLGV
ncbi:tRNA (cytidine(34)-2'-O)-methyltransferase [Agrococcus casei LMG 22410]|uniref:Putative tRNA (cytidine(34)-2'-O)-methyltransferase n=1 Tax=Agrococcus casei LMG 22410 TaxID=1255656 RepID=A0A1R4G733_9MICO|nr:tRNA (cytidine(34)-2'-O)-methyltransferase [Agrococcus casei LMG 22410]